MCFQCERAKQVEYVGNRQTGPNATKDTRYQYDIANRQTSGKLLDYGYDDLGNQNRRTVPGVPDTTKGWTLTWDNENRLVAMTRTKGSDSRTVSFAYDPFGRRIGKTLVTVVGGVTKTTTWTYVYDGDDIALEIYAPPAGPPEKTFYTHGPGVDEHLALERGGSYDYYLADGLGSITAITDQGGSVVQSYRYDSFGMVTPANTTFRNSYTYTGREWDSEAGLYYYRARYYDPVEGRFIGKDPLSFDAGDVVLYGYVQNNPLNYTDPNGEVRWGVLGTAVYGLYTIKSAIESAADYYYEYKVVQAYERYIDYLNKQLQKTKPCELERINYLQTELNKMVAERARLASIGLTKFYSDFIQLTVGEAKY